MNTRRVLKVDRGKALVQTTNSEFGNWTEWVQLPPPDVDQPLRPLASGQPEVALPGGLYGGDDRARRDTERRRAADAVLQAHGLRPRPW
jgi:hypothetical protein